MAKFDSPLVLALDSSTSATKAVVVTDTGDTVSEGRAPIDLLTPGMHRYEHDPAQWWESTHTAIRDAVAHFHVTTRSGLRRCPFRISGIFRVRG